MTLRERLQRILDTAESGSLSQPPLTRGDLRQIVDALDPSRYVNGSDRKDAERYRYLRAANRIMPGTPGTRPIEWYLGTVADEKIDAAIAESSISNKTVTSPSGDKESS